MIHGLSQIYFPTFIEQAIHSQAWKLQYAVPPKLPPSHISTDSPPHSHHPHSLFSIDGRHSTNHSTHMSHSPSLEVLREVPKDWTWSPPERDALEVFMVSECVGYSPVRTCLRLQLQWMFLWLIFFNTTF